MPNQSSFLRISGAQPFSAFMNKSGGSSKRKKKRTKNVSRKKSERRKNNRTVQKRTVQKKKKKSSRRKSNRSTSKTLTLPSFSSEKKLRCNCDKKRKIKGTEPSPKGLGYCAHCTPLITMKGKDGKLWENKKYTKGKRWVRVKMNQSGGFLRGGTF